MDILKIKNEDGTWTSIPAIIGPAYTLTPEDKQAIVDAVLAALPSGNEVAY